MNGQRGTTNGGRRPARSVVRPSAFVVSCVLLVLSSEFSVLSSSASPQEPVFKSGSSELVVLPVVVTDRHGRYVSDLPGEQFAVYDNGRATLWNLDPADLQRRACAVAGRRLTRAEWAAALPGRSYAPAC